MIGLKVPGKTVLNNAVTGLVMAVIIVPQGLANGVLAGVNPVFGLYSMIVGTTVAAFVTASVFMNLDSTSATALTAGEALASVTSEDQLGYLVVLGLLVGLFMLVFGLLKLGFLVRFVSNGSLFFAGVVELEKHLPTVGQAQGTAVILRLRDRDEVGSTFIHNIQRYTETLQAGSNLLMLEGLSKEVLEQLERTKLLDLIGEDNPFLGQKLHSASLRQALPAAKDWLAQQEGDKEGSAS